MIMGKQKKYWRIIYFLNEENRYGFIYASTNTPYKLVREMNKTDPEVDYQVYSEISEEEYNQSN